MPPVGPGAITLLKPQSVEQAYKTTLARLDKIQNHLSNAPRSLRLSGKVCIITGVNSLRGIGRATALAYAHAGAQHLYLLDYASDNLQNLKETIEKSSPDVKATVIQGDAADEETISSLCKRALREEGRLDVFFANAGVVSGQTLHQTTPEQWQEIMRINTLSAFLAIKHGSEAMLKVNASKGKEDTGGSIILTASVAGLRSGAGPIDYSASKAAVISTAKTSVHQLSGSNIRVNAICPGIIETDMTKPIFDSARSRGTTGKIGLLNPLGRYGISAEVAQLVLFLGSDEASYINGQAIAIDGGLSAAHPHIPGKMT